MISIDLLESILTTPKYNTGKTHFICECPYCNKAAHLYVSVQDCKLGLHQCKKCGSEGNLKKLLRILKRTDLLEILDTGIRRIITESELRKIEFDLYNPTIDLPGHTYRIFKNDYLDKRGFISSDYERYEVYEVFGERLVLFPIYENGEIKAYSKRSTLSNEVLKANKMRRWTHSRGSNLSNLLYGIDSINGAETAILVEGILDKISLDRKLNLYGSKICTICMFGKNISIPQCIKLNNAGIKIAVIMFDKDANRTTKKVAFKVSDYIDKVLVAPLGSKDPDTADKKELIESLKKVKTPLEFYSQYI